MHYRYAAAITKDIIDGPAISSTIRLCRQNGPGQPLSFSKAIIGLRMTRIGLDSLNQH